MKFTTKPAGQDKMSRPSKAKQPTEPMHNTPTEQPKESNEWMKYEIRAKGSVLGPARSFSTIMKILRKYE